MVVMVVLVVEVMAGGDGVRGGESRLSRAAGQWLEWPVRHRARVQDTVCGVCGEGRPSLPSGRTSRSPQSKLHCTAVRSAALHGAERPLLLLPLRAALGRLGGSVARDLGGTLRTGGEGGQRQAQDAGDQPG